MIFCKVENSGHKENAENIYIRIAVPVTADIFKQWKDSIKRKPVDQKDGKKSKTSKDQFLFSGYFFRQKQSDQTEDGKSSAEKGDAAINACGAKNIIG